MSVEESGSAGNEAHLILVGNFFSAEIQGEYFPPAPPLNFQGEKVVDGCVCLATRGKGRLFVPITLISKLTDNAPGIKKHEITAAPGIQHLTECGTKDAETNESVGQINRPIGHTCPTLSLAETRSEILRKGCDRYRSYYKELINAIQPIEDLIPESGKLKYCPGTNFFITPTWRIIFDITQKEVNADIIMRPTLTVKVE